MSGYAFMMGSCCNCGKMITFNPHKVPSLMINGQREPLCLDCANRWNELHPENARPIQPDAYDAIPEEEL